MVIKQGNKGENVKKVQRALQRRGFDIGDDGDFGPRTKRAVMEFQRQNGLDDDGKVGPMTIQALGLDGETLEALSGVGGSSSDAGATTADEAGGVTTITFTEDETRVPPAIVERVKEYVNLVVDQRRQILGSLVNAVAQFETTMQFASSGETTPDAFGAVLTKIFDSAVDELVSKVPGLSMAKSYFDAAAVELDRAANASDSNRVGTWIHDQRAATDTLMRQANPGNLQPDMESTYLEQDEEGRRVFFADLFEATEGIRNISGPDIHAFERQLYEAWINAQFGSISDDAQGCIEYRFKYEDEEFEFASCSVETPFGSRIAGRLNRLMDEGNLLGYGRPLDFAVRKRVCLRVTNLVGGKSWSCGWLDADNEEIHTPVHPPARKGLRHPRWRTMVTRFGE